MQCNVSQVQGSYIKKQMFPRHSHIKAPKLEDFIHQRKLGEGTYGSVSKYMHKKTLLSYAIKKISLKDKGKRDILMIQKQIQILYRINNDYIVKLIDHFENEEKNEIYLIMEYIEGSDLHKSIFVKKKKLEIQEIATIIYQIGRALNQLHKNNIIHRDLKLENVIYLPNKAIKLVDLGCSNYYGEEIQRLTSIGTRLYFSPQLLSGDSQDDRLDVWCLGVLLYELLFLVSPFRGQSIQLKIRKLQYEIPSPYDKDQLLVDLFSKIFCFKQKRIRARQLINHEWIQKYAKNDDFSFDIEKQMIDKQDIIRYKEFLLQEIKKCQDHIEKLKEDNFRLKKNIKTQSNDDPDTF